MKVKARIFRWTLSFGLMVVAPPAGAKGELRSDVSFAASRTRSSTAEDGVLHPIKKRVGRAVTSTMDKIDNPWFVVSQILMPLGVLLFSLMYVRRYRAKRAAESDAPTPYGGVETDNHEPVHSDRVAEGQSEQKSSGERKVRK